MTKSKKKTRPQYRVEVRHDELGPEEVIVDDVKTVHVERMTAGAFWIGMYFGDGKRVICNFDLVDGMITMTVIKEYEQS